MNCRKDALAAAAKHLLAVRDVVRAEPGTQVGTVGYVKAEPGAPNVIPGRVEFPVELRDLDAGKIKRMWQQMQEKLAQVDKEEGVETRCEVINDITAAPSDPSIQSAIREAARSAGLSTADMPSGAVHDAGEISRIAPMGMIFVPSRDGISHSPQEFYFVGELRQRRGSPLPLDSAARPAPVAKLNFPDIPLDLGMPTTRAAPATEDHWRFDWRSRSASLGLSFARGLRFGALYSYPWRMRAPFWSSYVLASWKSSPCNFASGQALIWSRLLLLPELVFWFAKSSLLALSVWYPRFSPDVCALPASRQTQRRSRCRRPVRRPQFLPQHQQPHRLE